MVSEISLIVQSAIATTLCNLQSDSRDEFSATKRTEGWTESFGDETVDPQEDCWKVEREFADGFSFYQDHSLLFPQVSIVLVQYRPAWLEQLVLRIAGIPHVVVNFSYASTESTGPLPFLRDSLQHTASESPSSSPVLVGRNHPRLRVAKAEDNGDGESVFVPIDGEEESSSLGAIRQGNSILEYLKSQKGVNLDAHWLEPKSGEDAIKSKMSLSNLFSVMIDNLQKHLMTLRYEDRNAWSLYRAQCFSASRSGAAINSSYRHSKIPTARGLYQAWSERVLSRKALLLGGKGVSLEKAKMETRKAYEVLEHFLRQRDKDDYYILGTPQPALIDAILWAYLAEAICDVNLVLILADFPLLVRYFQFIYDKYFLPRRSDDSSETEKWKVWNRRQNLSNQFQTVPLEPGIQKKAPKELKHALELMQTLSVQEHDLLEVLQVGKEARFQELVRDRSNNRNDPGFEGPKKEQMASALEKARRQQQRHDQDWISLVSGFAIVAGISSLAKMYQEG